MQQMLNNPWQFIQIIFIIKYFYVDINTTLYKLSIKEFVLNRLKIHCHN